MSILRFNTGRKGTSSRNIGYITRESACRSMSFHNLPELEAETQYEKRINALSYTQEREDIELKEKPNGRTHYRMILSWDRKEETDKAHEKAHEFLHENFKDSRAIVAIHQDTDHTHAHVWIDARQTDGKKIDLDRRTYRQLDECWARTYDHAYETNYAHEYAAKKRETREWKRGQRNQKRCEGKRELPQDKPERRRDQLKSNFWREKKNKDKGVERDDESRTGRNQRSFKMRTGRARTGEWEINDSEQLVERASHSIDQSSRQFDRAESKAGIVSRRGGQLNRQIDRTELQSRDVAFRSEHANQRIDRTDEQFGKIFDRIERMDKREHLTERDDRR